MFGVRVQQKFKGPSKPSSNRVLLVAFGIFGSFFPLFFMKQAGPSLSPTKVNNKYHKIQLGK